MASKRQQRLKQKKQANRQRQKERREQLGFNNFETIQIKDLENTIFYLYDTILSLIRDNKNYNIIEENEELKARLEEISKNNFSIIY